MKSLSPLNALLLATSCLFWPALATAQSPGPAEEPVAAEDTTLDTQASDAAEEMALEDDGTEMVDDTLVVRGRFIPVPMRETSEVATFLSSEDLARQGDSTAAAALTRLAGLSVVSGRFVFVRGLGDRYSSALLNGSPLPSPEPLRRTVPLDLFPSNILDGAAVQKTYSPNYPGEFGGGIIDLKTVRLPNETFLTGKIGVSGNPESNGTTGLTYFGTGQDGTGYDDGTRDVPGLLASAIARNVPIDNPNFTDAQIEAIGESLVNSPLSVIQSEQLEPNYEAELSAGTSIDIDGVNIGLVGVAGFDRGWRTEKALRQIGTTQIPIGRNQVSTSTTLDVTANALGSVAVGWGTNEVSLTTLYVHSTSKEAQIVTGADSNLPGTGIGATESTGWFERELATVQLAGEHEFGPLAVEWRGALAQSTRDAPYEREVGFQVDDNGQQVYGLSNRNRTRFSELTDEVASAGIDGAYTLPLSEQRDLVLTAGYAYSNTVRDYSLLQFLFLTNGSLPEDVQRARVDFLFGPDNIDPQRFVLAELTGPDDSYKGGLVVNAAYVGADAELTSFIRAALGVRFEDADQTVRTFNRLNLPTTAPVQIEEQYYLPAATLTWNFADDLQLRVGYSQTIARPQFRELAVSPYIDPDTDRSYRGNPFLVDSELRNFDARLEYYFDRNEFITVGGFYKDVENPIEEVQFETSTLSFVTAFINAPKAILYGAEVDYRIAFDSPVQWSFLNGSQMFFQANYTYTKSEVQADAGDLVFDPLNLGLQRSAADFSLDGVQLQGTPEHIANVQFGFEDADTQLTLLAGWVDERILQRGLGGLSDIVEDPGINLDLVFRQDFQVNGSRFTLGLSGRNLLGEDHEETLTSPAGELNFNTFDRGTTYSVSLSAKY